MSGLLALAAFEGLDNSKQVMEEKTTEEDAARLLTCSTTSLLEDGTLDEDDDNDTQASISAADLALIEVMKKALRQASPPAPPPLLSGPSVYYSGKAVWTPEECRVLEEGMQTYGTEGMSSVSRCIKIAALLPHKCVRDVAARVHLHNLQRDRASLSPDERMKRARMEAGAIEALQAAQRHAAMLFNPALLAAQIALPTQTQLNKVLRPVAGGSPPANSPVEELLQENVSLLTRIRDNNASMRMMDNLPLMAKIHANCQHINNHLASLPASLPPLPVTLDTRLLQFSAVNPASTLQAATAAAANMQAMMQQQQQQRGAGGPMKSPMSIFSSICMSPTQGN